MTFRRPVPIPARGHVEFIRLIRSDRILKVLAGSKLALPEELVYRYVTAVLDVHTELLVVTCDGWKREVPFHLSP